MDMGYNQEMQDDRRDAQMDTHVNIEPQRF